MRSRTATVLGVAAGLLALAAAGCGRGGDLPEMAKARGKVTYNGKPISDGTVTFSPIEGKGAAARPALGELEPDGSFELTTFDTGDGAVLGQHKVTIAPRIKATEAAASEMIPSQLPADIKKREGDKPPVPAKYMDPEKTPLRYTVRAGGNNFDIELKD